MIVHFVIVEPESKKGCHTVRLPLLVGRSREAKFRVQQERVSRRHCEFSAADGVVYVRDLGSTNGTHLEGRPVPLDPPTRVPPGALIRVGSLGFLVEYDGFAETPTVELRHSAIADSRHADPFDDGSGDVDILFGGDEPEAPLRGDAGAEQRLASSDGRPAPPPPADPAPEAGGESDSALRRFLDGLD